MSEEILYTSAPKGLKPGAKGFCTVVSTYGMAKNLAERLESLSGYRHAFLPPDPRVANNPINYSHLVATIGGRRYHILSRIADAGQDYTNRTNKLAHHIALEEQEIQLCLQGPAELLGQDGFCHTTWDGQLNGRHPGRKAPAGKAEPSQCEYWKHVAGDAGWAGVLAASALDDRKTPFSVIFKPGTDTLRLAVEALSILPARVRWDITFSTYFTRLPAGVDCFWRFLLDDTQEARTLRRNPHARVIDLCGKLAAPEPSDAVTASRQGLLIAAPEVQATAGPAFTIPRPAAAAGAAPAGPAPAAPPPAKTPAGARPGARPASPAASRRPVPPSSFSPLGRPAAARKFGMHWTTIVLAVAGSILILAVAAGIFRFVLFPPQRQVVQGPGGAVREQPAALSSPPGPPPDDPNSAQDEVGDRGEETDTGPEDDPGDVRAELEPALTDGQPVTGDESMSPADPGSAPAQVNDTGDSTAANPTPPKEPEPFAAIEAKGRRLALPPRGFGLAPTNTGEPVELAELDLQSPDDLELSILGADQVFSGGRSLLVEPADKNDGQENGRTWEIKTKAGYAEQLIGTFSVRGNRLTFAWDKDVDAKKGAQPDCLRYCILQLSAYGQTCKCVLCNPEEYGPETIDVDSPFFVGSFGDRSASQLPKPELLRVDLRVEGFPDYRSENMDGLVVGNTESLRTGKKDQQQGGTKYAFVRIPEPGGPDQKFIDINIVLAVDGKNCGLAYQLLSYQEWIPRGKDQPEVAEEPISTRRLDEIKQLAAATGKVQRELNDANKQRNLTERAFNQVNTVIANINRKLQENMNPNPLFPVDKRKIDQEIIELRSRLDREEQNRAKAEKNLKQIDAKIGRFENLLNFADENLKRCDSMGKVLERLHSDGKLHFRLYATVAGKEIEILRSTGFDEAKKPDDIPRSGGGQAGGQRSAPSTANAVSSGP